MNRIFSTKRYVLKTLVITFLIAMTISAAPSAQVTTREDAVRDDMMLIADRYATHQWTATAANIRHGTDNIDTPDMEWCVTNTYPVRTQGCWSIGPNIGVPYRWNGSTPIDDPDLGLYRLTEGLEEGNGYFREKIAAGKAAGDISITYDENGNQELSSTGNTAGVDCVGFINNAWRLGTRAGTSITNQKTLPIQLQTLKRGDILMKYGKYEQSGQPKDKDNTGNHVVLFEEFCSNVPGSPCFDANDPDAIMIKVYEASQGYRKVTESIWKILSSVPYQDSWHPDSPTNKVKMERFKVKLDGIWVDANPFIQDGYVPRTFIQPRDIVLVIDRSGSMGEENRIAQAKEAAKLFIDAMRPGDRIGIVSFAGSAKQIYPLPDPENPEDLMPLTEGEIEQNFFNSVRIDAKNAVADISLGSDGTTIGGGLSLGQQLLDTSDGENRTQLMILLSDGEEVSSPFWDSVKDEITVPVYTMPIGSFNYQVLLDIALETDGTFYPGASGFWVNFVFQQISIDTYREDIVKAVKKKVSSGGNAEETVLVDSTVGSVTFSLAWPGSDLDLTLVQPDGSVIDPSVAETDPNIEFVSGATYEFYKIFAPQKGEWTLRIFGKETSGPEEDYSMVASASDAMILSVDTDKDEYFMNDSIKITASIEDSFLDSPIEPEYIHGATMQVTVNNPNDNEFSFELFDDGLHDDGEADDGVYANTFGYPQTYLSGTYNLNLRISGNTNRDGQPFTREESLSVFLIDPPPSVKSILRTSASPTNYNTVDYRVTFSESVTGVGVSDFALTTEGVSGAAVSTVSGSGSNYTVTVNTGNGSGTIRLDVVDDDSIWDQKGQRLGDTGIGNGDFITGEIYNIDKTTISTLVTKLDDTNDGFCNTDCSLREAIIGAAPGDTITFDAALSDETIRIISTLTLSKNVTIDGSALAIPITISGDTNDNGTGDVQVFKVNAGVTATINSLTISKGRYGGDGGGIYNQGMLTIMGSTISDNSTAGSGGGIHNQGTLEIINSVISDNSGNSGGGIYNYGTLNVVRSTFSDNSAVWGAGLFNGGTLSATLTIRDSTFSDNSASSSGGGIYSRGILAINNSTFSGNSASIWGGAISQSSYNSLAIVNSTLSGNSALYGGGINNSAMLNYANTIIANSISGGDCYGGGSIGTNNRNLVEDGSCSAFLSGDPNLGPLADNGGATQTMALLAGSPAIDAGDDAVCAAAPVSNLDQRGITRPQGIQCDIGAFESASVENVAPVVNAGDDQTIILGNSVAITASYSDVDNSGNYSARIDWNDGIVEDVPVNMTDPGAGEVISEHTYTNSGNYTVEICVTDLYGGVGCDTMNVEVLPPPTGSTEINIGETYVLPYDDSGNGNLMVAQNVVLSQEATIQSLSFYVTNAAGNLRLGIYDDANGNPGTLVATTNEFTPIVGWNTQSVQTPALLPAGTYWLAYLPESSDLHFRNAWTGDGENSLRYYSYPYAEMPSTFSTSPQSGDFQFSFYATFTVTTEPGTMYLGEVNVLHSEADASGNLLILQEIELPNNAVVQSVSFYVTNAVGKVRLGIYDNNWLERPETRMAETDEFTPVVGWNTINVQTPALLPAGTYWLAFLPESDELEFKYETNPGLYTGRVYGYPFGELPSSISDQPVGVEYRYSFYATFITETLDDFGGATLNGMTLAPGANSGESETLDATSEFIVLSSQFNTNAKTDPIFGQEAPAVQKAYITFPPADSGKQNPLEKLQKNGEEKEGTIQVVFDVAGGRIQILIYDPQKGWVQRGKDISAKFADGDRFRASLQDDGTLEIYRNGKLLAQRDVLP